jgi:hypothetical protein
MDVYDIAAAVNKNGHVMSMQDRKKLALASFQRKIGELELDGARKVAANRLTVSSADGTKAVIQMLTIGGNLGVGEFAAYPTLGIHDGSVYEILKSTKLDGGSSYPKDLIVQGSSHALIPTLKRGVYEFRASADVERWWQGW